MEVRVHLTTSVVIIFLMSLLAALPIWYVAVAIHSAVLLDMTATLLLERAPRLVLEE